jgi:hypothetical protein
MIRKREKISRRGTNLYVTIPQKAVRAFGISHKRFFEWRKTLTDVIGTLCQSETVVTTRVQLIKKTQQYYAVLPHHYADVHGITPTRDGGPPAIFEWDDQSLQVQIPLGEKNKKGKAKTKGA